MTPEEGREDESATLERRRSMRAHRSHGAESKGCFPWCPPGAAPRGERRDRQRADTHGHRLPGTGTRWRRFSSQVFSTSPLFALRSASLSGKPRQSCFRAPPSVVDRTKRPDLGGARVPRSAECSLASCVRPARAKALLPGTRAGRPGQQCKQGSPRRTAVRRRPPRQPTPAPAPAMAAHGTAWADPRASSVSRVAPARNVGVSDVLFFYSDTL